MSLSVIAFQVQCPSCSQTFDIDPERIPLIGIQTVCSTCMRAFQVLLPDELSLEVESAMADLSRSPVTAASVEATWAPPSPEVARSPEVAAPPEAAAPAEAAEPPEVAEPPEAAEPPEVAELPELPEVAEPPEAAAPPEVAESSAPLDLKDVTEEATAEVWDAPMEAPEAPTEAVDDEIHDLRGLAEEALAEDEEPETPDPRREAAVADAFARFGDRDPTARARRLARVLVSDIIAYYPQKHEEAVQRGTVREEFEEEVQKSWKEYVDQVGEEMAESTDFFREALNEVLARGRQIF